MTYLPRSPSDRSLFETGIKRDRDSGERFAHRARRRGNFGGLEERGLVVPSTRSAARSGKLTSKVPALLLLSST